MECRWSERTAAKFSVALQYGPLGLIIGKVRDISAEGMFVETGRILVYRNDIVNLSFAYPHGEELRIINTQARVRHTAHNGIGLMFEGYKFEPLLQEESEEIIPAYH